MPRDVETNRINLAWLTRFRCVELAFQAAVIAVVEFGLEVHLPLAVLAAIVGFGLLSNLAVAAWLRRSSAVADGVLIAVLSFDVLLFTSLLAVTGGPYNPFSFLYVVQIALGALVLPAGAAAAIACLCAACFAAMFGWHVWLPTNGQELGPHELHHLRSHVQGMAFALTAASGFLVYFIQRMRRSLSQREQELSQARDLGQRHERLAALATLSAGAAHELSTPLSTIALVAGELDRQLQASPADPRILTDLALIRAEVDRCRRVLVQLAARAGESAGEGAERVTVEALVHRAVADLPANPSVAVELNGCASTTLRVPPNVVAQALAGIVRNAQQASQPGEGPQLRIRREPTTFAIEVIDAGAGMAPEVAARVGEPFFTTKSPGEGMGLGLFLARTTAEQLGGWLEIDSHPGKGTRVSFCVPATLTAAP